MVLKRLKVPKRSKRIRGGQTDEENEQRVDIKFLNFLTKISNDISSLINNDEKIKIDQKLKECGDNECYMTAEEAQNISKNLSARIINNEKYDIVPTKGCIRRTNAMKVSSDINNSAKQEQSEPTTEGRIIEQFKVIFNNILTTVNSSYKKDKKERESLSKDFQTFLYGLSFLPKIGESLEKLAADNELNEKYLNIIVLLNTRCKGFIFEKACKMAADGAEATELYDKIKKRDKWVKENITEDVLIDFIREIIPLLIYNLSKYNETIPFIKDLKNIQEILIAECDNQPQSSTGGKKSSRATHKEILGKQMKIYTKPNDKKEYVKHKGYLISIREYKEHMKHMKHGATGGTATGGPTTKKVILGKKRCIYKVQGSKQDHIKYKGSLITVSDYKNLMKNN